MAMRLAASEELWDAGMQKEPISSGVVIRSYWVLDIQHQQSKEQNKLFLLSFTGFSREKNMTEADEVHMRNNK